MKNSAIKYCKANKDDLDIVAIAEKNGATAMDSILRLVDEVFEDYYYDNRPEVVGEVR